MIVFGLNHVENSACASVLNENFYFVVIIIFQDSGSYGTVHAGREQSDLVFGYGVP